MTIIERLKHFFNGHTFEFDLNHPDQYINTTCLTCGKMLMVDTYECKAYEYKFNKKNDLR